MKQPRWCLNWAFEDGVASVRQEEVRSFQAEGKTCVRKLWYVATLFSVNCRCILWLRTEGEDWVWGEQMWWGQIIKTLVWQAKEFTVYAEVTGVCLKEFECGRNMAISGHIIDGWERSVWLCFAHFIGEEPISLELYAMVPGGYDEA